MTNNNQSGQSLALVALAIVAVVGALLLVVNGGALIQAKRAMDRATEDAAVAALRTAQVGGAFLDPTLAAKQAVQVLVIELANARGMEETPEKVAANAAIDVKGNGVQVRIAATICPPAWADCFLMKSEAFATLETTTPDALPTATPVAPVILPFPTPTSGIGPSQVLSA